MSSLRPTKYVESKQPSHAKWGFFKRSGMEPEHFFRTGTRNPQENERVVQAAVLCRKEARSRDQTDRTGRLG